MHDFAYLPLGLPFTPLVDPTREILAGLQPDPDVVHVAQEMDPRGTGMERNLVGNGLRRDRI
jgi:hypothetical protein